MRKTLSIWADNSWFLIAGNVFFATLFGAISLTLSRSQTPLVLLLGLGFIGSYCMDRVYRDLESQITVVMLFFSAFVVSGVNFKFASLLMGVPVGLFVSLAIANWMDQPNRQWKIDSKNHQRDSQKAALERRRSELYNKSIEGE